MKRLTLVLFLGIFSGFFNPSASHNEFAFHNEFGFTDAEHVQVLESSESVSLLKVERDGVFWYYAIARLAVGAIPYLSEGLCLIVTDDGEICKTVHSTVGILLAGVGNRSISKKLAGGLRWTVTGRSRGYSKATIETMVPEVAYTAYKLYQLYEDKGILKGAHIDTNGTKSGESLPDHQLDCNYKPLFLKQKENCLSKWR